MSQDETGETTSKIQFASSPGSKEDQSAGSGNEETGLDPAARLVLFGLQKYTHVWLFSIIFGALTAVSYSGFYFRLDEFARWGTLSYPMVMLACASLLSTLFAWRSLLFYLRMFLVPVFLTGKEASTEFAALMLISTVRYLVWAFAFRLCATAIHLTLQVLQYL